MSDVCHQPENISSDQYHMLDLCYKIHPIWKNIFQNCSDDIQTDDEYFNHSL